MICYFPTPYQDELLYSIVSRYQSHVVSAGNGATMKELLINKLRIWELSPLVI